MAGLHEGHRERMRERFAKNGFDGFADHEVLEVLLFGSIPRSNTNPLGHKLIDRFGSFAAVCDASIEELTSVEGIGRASALQIKMLPEYFKVYLRSHEENQQKNQTLDNVAHLKAYLRPYFIGKTREELIVLSVSSASQPLGITQISTGSESSTDVDLRKLIEAVVTSHASAAVLAHNHPRGVAMPSKQDIITTKEIYKHLRNLDIRLLDHLIFTENDCLSFHESNYSVID